MADLLNTCIVIPCYNEEKGISVKEYSLFLDNYPQAMICFVNDGSTDKTLDILNSLKEKHPDQIDIISLSKNSGKAEAVREGINHCNPKFCHQFIGYLDADLATTLEEFMEVKNYLKKDIVFTFGSRIRIIGSTIERNHSRYLTGRIIATIISNILNLKVYDTQCGCKIFTKDISEVLFKKKFISKWLFDVEIFFRMIHLFGKTEAVKKMREVPLKSWIEKGDSKVKATYFFQLWFDLYAIRKEYNNNAKAYL